LGLSIVRNIIEKHHSQVHLVSEVSVGTTFWFDLDVFEEKNTGVEQTPQVDTSPTNQAPTAASSLI
jgi:two-component system sensor histidine kinase NblS